MEVTAKMIGETISKLNREIRKLTEIRDGITNGTAKMTASEPVSMQRGMIAVSQKEWYGLKAENARLLEELNTVKRQLAMMKERRMKEDIDARDRIAELEVSELQKHIIAGKLADEAAAQKRRIAELETELLEANAKRLYAQGVAFETDEGQLEFGWSEMEEIDRARFRYMASTGATWMEAYAELSAGEEKTAPEEGRDGNK